MGPASVLCSGYDIRWTVSKLRVCKGDMMYRTQGYDNLPAQDGPYTLRRDGVEVMTGTLGECWTWIHRNHCYSVSHACKWEGYSIERVQL